MKKSKNKKNNQVWEGFDDCPICRAMKDGTANNLEGLEKAFKEAEKRDATRMVMRPVNKDDLYYDAMEMVDMGDYKTAEKLLIQARDMDPEYVQTYIGFTSVYGVSGQKEKAHKNIQIAYEKTQKQFPKWPRKMSWLDLENRAYLRAIQYMADLKADAGNKEEAIELYRLILKLNPNDNQGVRYLLAGLYAGKSGEEINKMFEDGNKKQNWNKLEQLVDIENKKHVFWKKSRGL
jgi:tetratricopeptide (TPR) repeat protein